MRTSITSALSAIVVGVFLTGCDYDYFLKSGYHHAKIIKNRVPIKTLLKQKDLNPEVRKKLLLVEKVKAFSEKELHLSRTDNYETYSQLDGPYVSYLLRASPRFELKHYKWDYPIVGKLPYKGYFSEEEAKQEAKKFQAKGFDTYVRGVTAYSTLGWFEDPVLSTMMSYPEHSFVDLIIHESVHATVFIKGAGDFNERLAVFVASIGTKKFYEQQEGAKSPAILALKKRKEDQRKFSTFIGKEINQLRKWYKTQKTPTLEAKNKKLKSIQNRFRKTLKTKLKTKSYKAFDEIPLNNARLLSFETYIKDLGDYQKVFDHFDKDLGKFLKYCESLEDSDDPAKSLKAFAQAL